MKKERTLPIVLGQFLEGITQAMGGATHMIHHHQDSRWFHIRAILEAVHQMIVAEVIDPMMKSKPKAPERKTII